VPLANEIRVCISACGVCRTDLHVVDGELANPHVPIIPGHEIVGLVRRALEAVRKGGRVVCAGIHMTDIPSFPYWLLCEERQVVSVANLTRQDGLDFLVVAPGAGIVTQTTPYPLHQANQALADLRAGRFEGAAVLIS
jgi:D-arabinose 1-dehydrogenase-like Zn-dependent alcohol dehydrogenase